jgi:hydroxypyruvate isomerase
MPMFSANLGFLWKELQLPDAIRAAKRAGFDAVECHYPYEVPVGDVKAALAETGMVIVRSTVPPSSSSTCTSSLWRDRSNPARRPNGRLPSLGRQQQMGTGSGPHRGHPSAALLETAR